MGLGENLGSRVLNVYVRSLVRSCLILTSCFAPFSTLVSPRRRHLAFAGSPSAPFDQQLALNVIHGPFTNNARHRPIDP